MRAHVEMLLLILVAATAACDDEGSTENDAGPDGGSVAPTIAVVGDAVVLGQGQTAQVELDVTDSDGDVESVTAVSDTAGLEAEVVENDGGSSWTLVLHADYAVVGTVSVTATVADSTELADSVDIQIEVVPLAWLETRTWSISGPSAREHSALIVDAEEGRFILLGGSGYAPYGTPLDDGWEHYLSSGNWRELELAGDTLPAGGSRRVAQVPGEAVAYLHGGYGEDLAPLNALYRVEYDTDPITVTSLGQRGSHGPRALHGLFFEAETGQLMVFGGSDGEPRNDLLVGTIDGDTVTWDEIDIPGELPSPRYGFFYAFDQELGRFVIYSGAQGVETVDPATDTWVLDVRAEPMTWTLLAEGEAEGVPPGRRNGCGVFDTSGPRLFVFGGTPDSLSQEPGLWALDMRPGREAWTLLELAGEPELRSSGFGARDPESGAVFLGFGNTTTEFYKDFSILGY